MWHSMKIFNIMFTFFFREGQLNVNAAQWFEIQASLYKSRLLFYSCCIQD